MSSIFTTYEIFKRPGFPVWLLSRFFASFAKQMETLIISWQVYEISKSALALGFVGLAQALPYIGTALWAGHAADHHNKKKIILFSLAGLLACGVGLMAVSTQSVVPLLPIYLLTAVSSALSSFEMTTVSAYLQIIIPKEDFPKAAAWNLSLFQSATISGPLIGGWLIYQFGTVAAYGVVAICFLISVLFAALLRKLPQVDALTSLPRWQGIKEGIRFLTTKKIIVGCMALDMFAVLFGDVIAILPIFAERFQVGPVGLGFLRSSPAIGSFLFSLSQAHMAFLTISWKNFLLTVGIFGVCMIGFALSSVFYLAVFFLIVSGAADAVSVIIRQSVYQRYTPDALRGRVASVSGIFIRISNELGAFESGLAAHLLGVVPSVIFGGAMTLLSVGFMRWKYPKLDES